MKKDNRTFGSFGFLPGLLFVGIILFGYVMAIAAFVALFLIPILIIVLLIYAFFTRDTKEERILNCELNNKQDELWKLEEDHRTMATSFDRWERICELKEEVKRLQTKRNSMHYRTEAYKKTLDFKGKIRFAFTKKIKKVDANKEMCKMSLIKCVECGGKVSDIAEKCPHCGVSVEYISNEYKKKEYIIIPDEEIEVDIDSINWTYLKKFVFPMS